MSTMTKITEEEALDWYDELLDEGSDVQVGGYYFQKSRILKQLDPIAYRCGFMDYVDSLSGIKIEVEGFES